MSSASQEFGVGPMASVAGAFAELIAKKGAELGSKKILVENGGDICMYAEHEEFTVRIHAGASPLSEKNWL